MNLKRGDRFLHKSWLDENRKPMLCEVTRVANGVVYWKQEGENKSRHYFQIEDAEKYVKGK